MAPVLLALGRGVVAGLLLGAAYRGWMRLLSTRPEFTWSGTLTIVAFVVVVTVLASLAAEARARWRSRPARAVVRTLAALSIYGVVQGLGMVAAPSVVFGALAVGRTGWPRWVRGLLGVLAVAGLGLLPFLEWSALGRLGWVRSTFALVCYLVLVAVFARLLLVSTSSVGGGWEKWPSRRLRRVQVAPHRLHMPATQSPAREVAVPVGSESDDGHVETQQAQAFADTGPPDGQAPAPRSARDL